jgi:hypothetical protein
MEVIEHRLGDQHAVERIAQRPGEAARWPCSMVKASGRKPSRVTQPATSAATSSASGNLPIRALVLISHALTALTSTLAGSAEIAATAFRLSFGSPSSHHSSAWVSSNGRKGYRPSHSFSSPSGKGSQNSGPIEARPRIEPKPRFGCSLW